MFIWANGWRPIPDDKRRLYLERELAWELAENPEHVLFGRRFVAVGWVGEYDDLILRLNDRDEFVWVHLSWNRENQPAWPHCEPLGGVAGVNRFVDEWTSTEDPGPK